MGKGKKPGLKNLKEGCCGQCDSCSCDKDKSKKKKKKKIILDKKKLS
jgi:hypothetical protein